MVKKIIKTTCLATFSAGIASTILLSGPDLNAKTIFVSIDGESGNNGTSFSSGYDFKTALGKVSPGDTILVQGGTHKVANNKTVSNAFTIKISGSSGKWIHIVAEIGERATFDFQWKENSRVVTGKDIRSYGFYFEQSAKYLHFDRIGITQTGYQGVYVTGSYITFENCLFFNNWNSGAEVNLGGSHVIFLNCDANGNYDGTYKNGGMADGFAVKQDIGPGNQLINCRAWDNSDDGYDTFGERGDPVLFENCWAFNNGYDEGNRNGFKVGGNKVPQKNILKNCIAFGHDGKGFDQNTNTAGITLYNCTSYKNGTNYGFGGNVSDGKHVFKNCISLSSKNPDAFGEGTQSHNSWSSGFLVKSSDFGSLDLSMASIKRNIDGTIPETELFRLSSTSKLIDAGVDVGIPYYGSKPDPGAFEHTPSTGIVSSYTKVKINASQYVRNNQLMVSLTSVAGDMRVDVYSLNGMKVLGAKERKKRTFSVDCSSIASGRYITELSVDGIKEQMMFTK